MRRGLFKRLKQIGISSSSERPAPDTEPGPTLTEIREEPLESLEPFVYEPLPDPAADVRLIRRKRNGSQLDFDVLTVNQRVTPDYIALSYTHVTRSSSIDRRDILLNGKVFSICDNLYQALKHDCVPYESMAWVDAICINQSDVQEKSQQVQIMHNIFKHATHTIAWIGDHHADEIGMLFQLAQGFPHLRAQYDSNEDWCMANATCLTQDLPSTDTVLRHFFNRPYWSRLWTLTEIALSKEIVVRCGSFSLGISGVEAIHECASLISSININEICRLRAFLTVRHFVQEAPHLLTVSGTLELSRARFEVQTPHDRIYSILGLFPDLLPITVDYTEPIEHVLTDLMASRLMIEGPDVLGEAQIVVSPDRNNLPSWVGDIEGHSLRSFNKQFALPYATEHLESSNHPQSDHLSMTTSTAARRPNRLCKHSPAYRASSSTKAHIQVHRGTVHPEPAITVTGVRIATVVTVANADSSTTFGSNRVQTWLATQYKQHRFTAAQRYAPTLSGSPLNSTVNTSTPVPFYHLPTKPFTPYPSTSQEKDKLSWEQLMNPYTLFPEYWGLLDLTMGPTYRTMCAATSSTAPSSSPTTTPAPLHEPCTCNTADQTTDQTAFAHQIDFFDDARRAFQTSSESCRYGIGPGTVRAGDVLVVFYGASVPHILRPLVGADSGDGRDGGGGDDDNDDNDDNGDSGKERNRCKYRYIGEAFVKGLMEGEAFMGQDNAVVRKEEEFTLI